MKKSPLVLALLLLLSIAASAQENWITKPLDDKLSVKFPSDAEKTTKNGVISFTAMEKDSVVYVTGLTDMYVVAKLDSATLAPLKDNPMFAEKILAGMASQKPGYKFGTVKIGKWNTLTTYHVTGIESATNKTLYIQLIFLGSKIYSFSCTIPADVKTKNKDLFFNSPALSK